MLNTHIISVSKFSATDNLIILCDKEALDWADSILSKEEASLLRASAKLEAPYLLLSNAGRWVLVEFTPNKSDENAQKEAMRRNGGNRVGQLRQAKIDSVCLVNYAANNLSAAYVEGLVLGNYQFIKYFQNPEKQATCFKTLKVSEEAISSKELTQLAILLEGVAVVRDLVNEPHSYLNAVQLSKEIAKLAQTAGFKHTCFDKAKITELGMGGLLAVNKGSQIPPTFNIMEWKPQNAKNSKPIVLVGKGVVYDTGGLSLKPTANSMDFMKCDMAGAGVVIGAMYLIAKLQLPLHIIGLVPATDNRPGEDAYAPGDVIKMFSGLFVEVLNTDAEGRMILADALHYAKQYDPELVFDFATLTGSASAAIGAHACVLMGNADQEIKDKVQAAGYRTHERMVEFPIWEEYGEEIKSDIADIKNLGGPQGGAITAAKFLEHFTDYPWLHFDIAGVAFMHKENAYRVKGGTGFGVRMLIDFLSNY